MKLHDRVSRRLKLRDLRLLLAVAEWGTMAKAAAHLNLTQSGVSKAIGELEHTLGVRLFDRSAQGVEPTLYGRALLKGGAAVFDELRRSVDEIEHLTDPAAGELRIGCTEPMSWGIVPTAIDRLVRQHPRAAFQVTQADPVALRYHELPERRIEVAVGRIAGPVRDDDVDVEVLYQERVYVVAGAQSPWARRRRIKLADLVVEPWTLPTPESYPRSLLADAFQAAGLPAPRVNVVAFSISLHTALLAGGQFLCVLPHSLLEFAAKLPLKILPVKLPLRPGPVGIMTLKNRTASPLARRFIDTARQIARAMSM